MVHVKDANWTSADKMREALLGACPLEKLEEKIKSFVYRWCSEPTTELVGNEYVPSQLIAERLRDKGFDGIIYDSAMDEDQIAGVLFCPKAQDPQFYFPTIVEFQACHLTRVKSVNVDFDKEYEQDPTILSHADECTLAGHKRHCIASAGLRLPTC